MCLAVNNLFVESLRGGKTFQKTASDNAQVRVVQSNISRNMLQKTESDNAEKSVCR